MSVSERLTNVLGVFFTMNIFVLIALAMVLTVVLLRFKLPIGVAIFVGGLLIWGCTNPDPMLLVKSVEQMFAEPRTYDLILALYFVMCLEIELRKGGALSGMVKFLYRVFASAKFTLAAMPAFLGVLPSVGGARFSAPIVREASKNMQVDDNQRAAINYWFRHVFEFSSPIIPGMILACGIAGVSVGDLILHLGWMTILSFLVGWLVLIRPIKAQENPIPLENAQERRRELTDFIMALSPVIVNVILMVCFGIQASLAMAMVVVAMIPVLWGFNRTVGLREIFLGALDWKMLANVSCILLFIQVLDTTGVLAQIVSAFEGSVLPVPVIIAVISFLVGVLTGMSQGHVAIVMPIIAAMSLGNLDLVGIAMVFGVGGQMVTPTHVCLTVTLDYFKADFFKTLIPIVLAQAILFAAFTVVTYFTYG